MGLGAEQAYQRALELDPNSSTVHRDYGGDLIGLGRFDEALKELELAVELDPISTNRNQYLAWGYKMARPCPLA